MHAGELTELGSMMAEQGKNENLGSFQMAYNQEAKANLLSHFLNCMVIIATVNP